MTWWTRERVLTGLRRFYREQRRVITATAEWHCLTRFTGKGRTRHYPSSYAVLKYFRTLRQAWAAAGVEVDRNHEDFTPEEEWYMREAAGLLSRREMARDLRRTSVAVHTWLNRHGINCFELHGWTPGRIERATGFKAWRTLELIYSGELPAIRGSKCWYVQPADLVGVAGIDWSKGSPEVEQVARRQWVGRLVRVLGRYSLEVKTCHF